MNDRQQTIMSDGIEYTVTQGESGWYCLIYKTYCIGVYQTIDEVYERLGETTMNVVPESHIPCTISYRDGNLIIRTMAGTEIGFVQDSTDVSLVLGDCTLTPEDLDELDRGWAVDTYMYDEMYWSFATQPE